MKPSASRIERMPEKVEAKLVPPERKWLSAIVDDTDDEAMVKEKLLNLLDSLRGKFDASAPNGRDGIRHRHRHRHGCTPGSRRGNSPFTQPSTD